MLFAGSAPMKNGWNPSAPGRLCTASFVYEANDRANAVLLSPAEPSPKMVVLGTLTVIST